MRPHPECGACLVHWVFERAVPHTPEGEVSRLIRGIVDVLLRFTSPEANVGTLCNKTVHKVFEFTPKLAGHYEELKRVSNENAKKILPEARKYIDQAGTPREKLARACALAAAANVAPLNAPSHPYTFEEIRHLMGEGIGGVVVDDLLDTISASRRLLYVTDNAGEIGFDSLLIRQVKELGPKIVLVVKEGTYFEDATLSDVVFFGLEKLVDGVVTIPGFMAPSELGPSPLQALNEADFVMAKGTGAYEALRGEVGRKKAAYLLKIKCKPIARELEMAEGTVIVKLE